jgi:hypothetical protein
MLLWALAAEAALEAFTVMLRVLMSISSFPEEFSCLAVAATLDWE